MEKYSKEKLKRKRGVKKLIIILVIIIVLCLAGLIYILLNNNIVKERIDNNARFIGDNEAANSTPIIVNNLIVGATYDTKWVSAGRYYTKGTNKNEFEVDLFNKDGKLGTYKLNEITQQPDSTSVYTTTTRVNLVDEYYGVAKDTSKVASKTISSTITDEDTKNVKKALGIYRMLNTSVKVKEVYEVSITNDVYGKVIIATNEPGKSFGAFTVAVFVDNAGNASIIKYNYIRNLKNASDWPVYSLKFVADLNSDSSKELVLVEAKEFEAKYSVLEYRNGKFYEVLSSVVK